MPHINMLYPFISDANEGQVFSDAASRLTTALEKVKPFTVKFTRDSFKCFMRKKNCTLWLKPIAAVTEEEEALEGGATGSDVTSVEDLGIAHQEVTRLQRVLVDTFPECNDVNNISDKGFTPHLSLGQFRPKEVSKFAQEFQKSWTDFEFEVSEVCLISRADFHDPFHVRHRVKLSGKP